MPKVPPRPVLSTVSRSAEELAAELRREFERALYERYGQGAPTQDPVLAALFQATAAQIARVYNEAEQVFPEAVFDDLIGGLGMPPRAAQPAQTVIGFRAADAPELVGPDLAFVGENKRGEKFTFTLDVPVRVGPVRLVFAGVTEAGRLSTLTGASLPTEPGTRLLTTEPLTTGTTLLGDAYAEVAPTLFLAFEAGDAHLGGLGLYLDAPAADHPTALALARSAWQLVDEHGATRETLVLRSRSGPGGVRLLDWQRNATAPPDDVLAAQNVAEIAPGPYGPQCYVFPEVPPPRRVRSGVPRAIADALPRVLPPGVAPLYERPLVWVQVALPAGTRGVASTLQRVIAHAGVASNIEVFAEQIVLGELGAAVAVRPESMRSRHLISVLSVSGQQGEPYADDADPTAELGRGRYRLRGSELEFRAARGPTGRFDRYVMVRLLYTDGARANGFQPNDVAGRSARRGSVGTFARNLTLARGGSAPPAYAPAKVRFAELLRTRERVVTPADVDIAARAFDPRVTGAEVEVAAELGENGVARRVELVTVRVRAADFTEPETELPRLAVALEAHLAERAALGAAFRVRTRPEQRGEVRPAKRGGGVRGGVRGGVGGGMTGEWR